MDWAWGAWIGLLPLISFLLSPARLPLYMYESGDTRYISPLLNLSVTAVIWSGAGLALLDFVLRERDFRLTRNFLVLGLPVILTVPLSLFPDPTARDIALACNALLVFSLALVVTADRRPETRIRRLLCGVAAVHVLAMILVLADGNFVYGRLMGRTGANFWGATGAATIFCALAFRPLPLRVLLAGFSLAVILLTQNRTALIGVTAGLLTVAAIHYRHSGREARLLMLAGASVGLCVLIAAFPLISENVLRLDDPRRGLASGGTGRFDAWREAFSIFEANPFLGVGYRRHDDLIRAATSAHNAYLGVLADMGAIGLAAYLLLLGGGLAMALRRVWRERSGVNLALAGLIVCYAVQGMFETRGLNFANSYSLTFFFALAWSCRPLGAERSGQRAGSPTSRTVASDRPVSRA